MKILRRERSTRNRQLIPALVIGALVVAGTAACTSDSDGSPSPTSSSSSASGAGGGNATSLAAAAEAVSKQYLSAPEPEAIASVKGTIRGFLADGKTTTSPGQIEVLALESSATSTMLKWRITSEKPFQGLDLVTYGDLEWPEKNASQVVLESKQADLRLHSSHWNGVQPHSVNCTCAMMPEYLSSSDAEELTSLFPTLPESVTEVQLRVPDFPALTLPVTRK